MENESLETSDYFQPIWNVVVRFSCAACWRQCASLVWGLARVCASFGNLARECQSRQMWWEGAFLCSLDCVELIWPTVSVCVCACICVCVCKRYSWYWRTVTGHMCTYHVPICILCEQLYIIFAQHMFVYIRMRNLQRDRCMVNVSAITDWCVFIRDTRHSRYERNAIELATHTHIQQQSHATCAVRSDVCNLQWQSRPTLHVPTTIFCCTLWQKPNSWITQPARGTVFNAYYTNVIACTFVTLIIPKRRRHFQS